MEPRFVLLKGTVYPVLGKFETLILRHKDLEVCTFIIVQTSNGINTLNQNLSPQLLGPSDVFPLTLKGVKKSFSLDNDYYPNQAIIEDAVRESIDNIVTEQSILVEELGCSKCFLKWQTYEKLLDYATSPPEDLIEVVRKDILE